MIDLLFEILILKSIGMTLLLALIIAVRPLVLKWMNARVAYGLWLMLPVYLLLPINFIEVSSTGGVMTFFLGADNLSVNLVDKVMTTDGVIARWCLGMWAGGSLLTLFLFFLRYRQLSNSLRPMESGEIGRLLEKIESAILRQVQLKEIQFVTTSLVSVPAVFGLFKSYLILPINFFELPQQNQQIILQHELYHLARHDHQTHYVRVLIKSFFWFNPMFFFADKYCEADQEMSCDLGVLENSDAQKRIIYARILLESSAGVKQNRLVSQWKYHSLIKERIKMLKNTSLKKWHSWLMWVFGASAIWMTSGVVMAEKEQVTASEAIPMVIIQPRYPRKAALDGIEGWVKFKFKVDSTGSPYELKLIDSLPKNIFESESTKAIRQWKFKPDGTANDLIYTMEFQLAPSDEVK